MYDIRCTKYDIEPVEIINRFFICRNEPHCNFKPETLNYIYAGFN